jgi:hypothetical protein
VEPPAGNRTGDHPNHGTTRNRCANHRFPRSRPTVRAEVIGSPSAKVCAHHKPPTPSQEPIGAKGLPCLILDPLWSCARARLPGCPLKGRARPPPRKSGRLPPGGQAGNRSHFWTGYRV